jgi:hypothetical protein
MLTMRTFFLLLLSSFGLWNCGADYPLTLARVEKEGSFTREFVNKKVELHTRHDEIIIGYLVKVENDSVVINLRKDKDSVKKFANLEISYLNVLNDPVPALVAGVAVLFAVMIIYLPGHTQSSFFPDL